MLNKDYYKDAIFELAFRGQGVAIIDGKPTACINISCTGCDLQGADKSCAEARWDWANSECEEKVDWAKVRQNTPVLVRNDPNDDWRRRYFARFKDGRVYVYNDGATSWSSISTGWWKYAKLSPITNETGTN